MEIRDMAKMLGSRGGFSRARRLSDSERAEIARAGGRARAESLRVAEAIRSNFAHLAAVRRLHRPKPVRPVSTCNRPLPGLYGREITDQGNG